MVLKTLVCFIFFHWELIRAVTVIGLKKFQIKHQSERKPFNSYALSADLVLDIIAPDKGKKSEVCGACFIGLFFFCHFLNFLIRNSYNWFFRHKRNLH